MKKILILALIAAFSLSTNHTSALTSATATATEPSLDAENEDEVQSEEQATPAAAEEVAPTAEAKEEEVVIENTLTPAPAPTPAPTPAPAPAPRLVAQAAPAPAKTAAAQPKSTAPKAAPTATKKKSSAAKSRAPKPRSGAAKPRSNRPSAAKSGKPAAEQAKQKGDTVSTNQRMTPSEQQARAEAKKSATPAVSMAETKAYELFKDANYDVAAPYFVRMADEKRFVLTGDMNYERVDKIVEKYVDAQMAKFLVKGEFEKTAVYVLRVNEENRKKKIQEFATTIFNELKKREKKSVSIHDFSLSRYYADDESFLLSSPNGAYVLGVDMAGARSFKSNFNKLRMGDLDFIVDTSGIFVLSNFSLTNPENSKRYIFNSGMSTTYNVMGLEKRYTALLGPGTPTSSQSAKADSALLKAFRNTAPQPQPTTVAAPSEKLPSVTTTTAAPDSVATATTPAPAAPAQADTTPPSSVEPKEAKVSETDSEMTLEN